MVNYCDYTEMHGQQNIKKLFVYLFVCVRVCSLKMVSVSDNVALSEMIIPWTRKDLEGEVVTQFEILFQNLLGGTADVLPVTFLNASCKPPAWYEVPDIHVLRVRLFKKPKMKYDVNSNSSLLARCTCYARFGLWCVWETRNSFRMTLTSICTWPCWPCSLISSHV